MSVPSIPTVEPIKGAVEASRLGVEAAGLRNALLSVLDDVEQTIDAGDDSEAIRELLNLQRHLNGCGAAADRDDWIVSCDAQDDVGGLIDGPIGLSERLMRTVAVIDRGRSA